MTSVVRVYVVAVSLLVFLVLWATVAASPWAPARAAGDTSLAAREAAVRAEAQRAEREHAARWAAYRATVAERRDAAALAAVPTPVRIIGVPPVATTRSS